MTTNENRTAFDRSPVLYVTGYTPDGIALVGGVWTLWEQEGLPLEMSHLVCRDTNRAVDWLEAIADASTTHNAPALIKHIEAFLPDDAMEAIKTGFVRLIYSGKTFKQILAEKRLNGAAVAAL